MRALLLTLVIVGCVPAIIWNPYVGVLVFSWLSYMNPHQYIWGASADFPFVFLIGGLTVVAWLLSREPKRLPWNAVTVLLGVFTLWISFTTLFMMFPEDGYPKWVQAIKILMFNGFVTLGLITSRRRMDLLIWVIVGSIGPFAAKGGIFVIASGGQYLVFGPLGGMMEDNTAFALAVLTILPLMRYLQLSSNHLWVRWGLTGLMVLSLISIIGTQSRGALIGLIVLGAFILVKMRGRVLIGTILALSVFSAIVFMPQAWRERMETIVDYQTDPSAIGRLEAWDYALDLATQRPIVGGGFGAFAGNILEEAPELSRNAHSIYFEVLGEHGYVGLALYLLLGFAAFRAGSWVLRNTRGDPDMTPARDLAAMLQVSLVTFAAVGAFLNLAFIDLIFHIVALSAVNMALVHSEIRDWRGSPEPGSRDRAPGRPSDAPVEGLAHGTSPGVS